MDGVEAALSALRRNVLAFKAGRVLSATNLNHLRGAMAHLEELGDAHKAAREHISAVLDAGAPMGDPDPDDPVDPNRNELLAAVRSLRRTIASAGV